MGLMLSVLVTYAGVLEAVYCYHKFIRGMIPEGQPDFEYLTKKYEDLFTESLSQSRSNADDWKRGGQGYLELTGGGKNGPLVAKIKYFGQNQDSTPLLFSTKISSFGQESVESERHSNKSSPMRDFSPRPEINIEESHFQNDEKPSSDSSGFWNDSNEPTEVAEPKEKIKWHYRPLTPTENSVLPEIHFDSYERKSTDNDERSPYSEEFLRSLDGVKFRPLQRDDGTGRRRSFKKRHSSSSTSSRDSNKASREEELNMFTSLEESEFENHVVQPTDFSSAPNLTADYNNKSRSRNRSREEKSSPEVETEPSKDQRECRSPSAERRRLRDLPKESSFEELPTEDLHSTSEIEKVATTTNGTGTTVMEINDEESEDTGVNFWDL